MTDSALASQFIPANPAHMGGDNGRITRVVIHATVSPCVDGGAVGNAHYFQSATAGGAAHYVVDPSVIVQCVPENRVAHHAPPNAHSVGIELCDPQRGDGGRWGDDKHKAMLALASALTADICKRQHIPAVWLSASQLLAGDLGITSHANVSAAWRQTDHTDPGPDFPTVAFMAAVTGGTDPGPVPVPPLEEEMAPAVAFDAHGTQWFAVRGTDNHLWTKEGDGAWTERGGTLTSGPSIAVKDDGSLAFAARGTDGATWWCWVSAGGVWSPWVSAGGKS